MTETLEAPTPDAARAAPGGSAASAASAAPTSPAAAATAAADTTAAGVATNPHLLDHLAETGRTRGVEASEDIFSANGIKLLAKGARIAPEHQERLLQHRLLKPLEQCIAVADTIGVEALAALAADLLVSHPVLARLCEAPRTRPVAETIAALRLTVPVRSLLTIYGREPRRLRHTVGVALGAIGLARRVLAGRVEEQRVLALAGLMHDVGELYLDPTLFDGSRRIGAREWRHIVSHPVAGHRVLELLDGAGPPVADAVLLHHERVSGYGYPRGVAGAEVHLHGQILGAAEWLMATLESSKRSRAPMGVATRLVADDFAPAIVAALGTASAGCGPAGAADAEAFSAVTPRVARIADTLARHRELLPWIHGHKATASALLRQALERGEQRMRRIEAGFASVGLNSATPEVLMPQLAALNDAGLQHELIAVVQELEWRLREIERESLLRAGSMPAAEAAVLHELVARIKPKSQQRPPP